MVLVAPISPEALFEACKRAGFKLIDEGQHSWVVAQGDKDQPLVIPKHGKRVSVRIMSQAQQRGIGTPLMRELLAESRKQSEAAQDDADDDP